MSYILDALRRADAERGRGAVPGLHSQAAPAAGELPAVHRAAPAPLWAVAAAVVGVAVLAAGGTWWALRPQAPVATAVAPAAPAVVAPAPAAPATPTAPVTTAAPVAPPPPLASSVPAPAPAPEPALARTAPPAPAPEPRPADSKRAADKRGGTARERERPVAAVVVAPPAARAPAADPARPRESLGAPLPANGSAPRSTQDPGAAPPPASPVFAQTDLPDTLRAQLPALKVTGATHSSNPVYRMAIVNGQVLHEGDQAAPGLVLEKIEPGRTVWTFRGYRYAVAAQ
ncbi:hypothetical protein GmRootA79_33740 [Acidovorax sp. A79]|uniref:general secretion pathway protein GspB n=1 Tax=Acidovorax sp. A79 TaxID=3056107 RepID=UPI0034E877E4